MAGERAACWLALWLRLWLCVAVGSGPAHAVVTQEPGVLLRQGVVSGIKVITESRRPISAYLGIPYAIPPVGELRFAPPTPHAGWNGTLLAGRYGPPCPQLPAPGPPLAPYSEDCLTLNVWVPERTWQRLPVLVLLEGEGFVSGSPSRLPAHDLAVEDLIVVSVSYRLNVFGFLCLEDGSARGNLGLLDQYLALRWVRDNIEHFGGDPSSVTLMGHSAGAASVVYHMVSPRTTGLFHRAIVMSGSVAAPWARSRHPANSSRGVARSLGCLAPDSELMLRCLRNKSVAEVLRAFEDQYQSGNWTDLTLPVVDSFLPESDRYLPLDPLEALQLGSYRQVPVLTGITSAEGAFALYEWDDGVRQASEAQLRQLLEDSVLPQVARRYGWGDSAAVREALLWRYAPSGLAAMLQVVSDSQFVAPHAHQLELLVNSPQPVYSYYYDQPGPDLYGSSLNITGAAHGSELLHLLGPSLMQQLSGRRPSGTEERFGRMIRQMWAEFSRTGNPLQETSYSYTFPWRRATPDDIYSRVLTAGNTVGTTRNLAKTAAFWNKLLPKLGSMGQSPPSAYDSGPRSGLTDQSQPFRSAVYTLIGIVTVLLVVLVVCLVLLKHRSKERQSDLF
ncbi:carboxylesterase 4A-like [Schistocerca nitens]|uniref:carboxylesterase 4A-like n=1 Tax=Schistocerca nitens TaxID=7011 RepID=UPI0021177151|nr:carboxylesterase 4A-like [Schistocerca nitens]